MNDYGRLPATGVGTLAVGGLMIEQAQVVGLALGLVLVGAVLIRLTFRRRKGLTDQ